MATSGHDPPREDEPQVIDAGTKRRFDA